MSQYKDIPEKDFLLTDKFEVVSEGHSLAYKDLCKGCIFFLHHHSANGTWVHKQRNKRTGEIHCRCKLSPGNSLSLCAWYKQRYYCPTVREEIP